MKTNKLWNILMMLVLVLGTTMAFSSCSKDDDESNNDNGSENTTNSNGLNLIGRSFKYVSYFDTGDGYPDCQKYQITFTSATNCELLEYGYEYIYDRSPDVPTKHNYTYDVYKTTYSVSGNKVTIKWGSGYDGKYLYDRTFTYIGGRLIDGDEIFE